jgi:rod shape determining protein RodA
LTAVPIGTSAPLARSAGLARPAGRARARVPWRHADISLIAATLLTASIGLVIVYFATRSRLAAAGADPAYLLRRQALFAAIGVLVMVLLARIDYRRLTDRAPWLYAATVIALGLVVSPLGVSSKGHQAWFALGSVQFQPSELSKVAVIVCVAAYLGRSASDAVSVRRLLTVLALAGLPMILILRQPDLGTDLVYAAVLAAAVLVGGVRARHLVALAVIAVAGVVGVAHSGVLHPYQVDRITAFVDQHGDAQGSTYNLQQSKMAISAGGLTGEGLGRGTQTNRSFVPEQHTDFVFSVVGEELGFAGSALLLGLLAFIIWRMWRAACLARDRAGTLICVQVMALMVFQVFENVGMTMGIMPITGIPLPFVSYGGSAMVACFAGTGLVLSVHQHRFRPASSPAQPRGPR